jgi:hypothetical protein
LAAGCGAAALAALRVPTTAPFASGVARMFRLVAVARPSAAQPSARPRVRRAAASSGSLPPAQPPNSPPMHARAIAAAKRVIEMVPLGAILARQLAVSSSCAGSSATVEEGDPITCVAAWLCGIAVALLALERMTLERRPQAPVRRASKSDSTCGRVAGKIDTDKGGAIHAHQLLRHPGEPERRGDAPRAGTLDKFSIVFDGEYAQLESDRESRTIRIGPRGNIEILADAKAELDMWIFELNGGYELFEARSPFARSASSPMHAHGEVYAGARYYGLKPEIDINIGQFHDSTGDWERWLDGVVGLRFGIDLSKTVVPAPGPSAASTSGTPRVLPVAITSLGWASRT